MPQLAKCLPVSVRIQVAGRALLRQTMMGGLEMEEPGASMAQWFPISSLLEMEEPGASMAQWFPISSLLQLKSSLGSMIFPNQQVLVFL